MEHERQRVTLNELIRKPDIKWHGVKLGQPDWSRDSHSLGLEVELKREALRIYLILNAYWEPLDFELPQEGGDAASPWRRWIDTALESPHDIAPWPVAALVADRTYRAAARSVVVLVV